MILGTLMILLPSSIRLNYRKKTEADAAKGILKNTTIAVPLKYISNF